MTQPIPPGSEPIALRLPEPVEPVVSRMVSQAPLTGKAGTVGLYVWTIGHDNPLAADYRIVRMLFDRGGVDVYSLHKDGQKGARHHVPALMIRLVEEQMDAVVLLEEIEAAESDEGEDDDEGEGGFEDEAPRAESIPIGPPPPANGQA